MLLRYALLHHGQVARATACNGLHHIDQRLAARRQRMGHDRADGSEYPITREILSMMLGLSRARISVAAGTSRRPG